MALEKDIETPLGINATYWCLAKVEVDKFNNNVFLILYGFKDKDMCEKAKIGNAMFMDRKYYNIYPEQFDKYFSLDILNSSEDNQYKQGYQFIKDVDAIFKDATDC